MKKFIHGTRGFVNQLHINQTIGLAITRIPDIFTEIEETTGDLEKLAYNFRVKDFYNFSINTKKTLFHTFETKNISGSQRAFLESMEIDIDNIVTGKRCLWNKKGIINFKLE